MGGIPETPKIGRKKIYSLKVIFNITGEKSKYCFCNTNKKKQDKVFSAGEDKRLDKQTEGDFIIMEK